MLPQAVDAKTQREVCPFDFLQYRLFHFKAQLGLVERFCTPHVSFSVNNLYRNAICVSSFIDILLKYSFELKDCPIESTDWCTEVHVNSNPGDPTSSGAFGAPGTRMLVRRFTSDPSHYGIITNR